MVAKISKVSRASRPIRSPLHFLHSLDATVVLGYGTPSEARAIPTGQVRHPDPGSPMRHSATERR